MPTEQKIVSLAELEIKILSLLAIVDLDIDDGAAEDSLYSLIEDAEILGYNSEDGKNPYHLLEVPHAIKRNLVDSFDEGIQRKQEYLAMNPPLSQLERNWDAMDSDAREEIYQQFQMDCINGSAEPDPYWYPLLMPINMHGYVGD